MKYILQFIAFYTTVILCASIPIIDPIEGKNILTIILKNLQKIYDGGLKID